MNVLAVLCVFAPLVMSQQVSDPTKVCLPNQLSGLAINLIDERPANFSMDFGLQKVAAQNDTNRYVIDLAKNQGYAFDAQDTCTKFPLGLFSRWFQCLPSAAVFQTQIEAGLGSVSYIADLYEINVGANVSAGILLSRESTYSLPLLRRDFFNGEQRLTLFANPKLGVSDPTIFNVPANC
ncbi:uncharacterized protein LOC101850777 [Aplysia californica]|uniref:Uncharacterized protein LOC101850777 n=1 Tax=Aplysia californica TaxID=6500 RepID=A0ABM0KB66_APLCA|nr:uncharacterized protein LOC101850777 [Aplysia californica]